MPCGISGQRKHGGKVRLLVLDSADGLTHMTIGAGYTIPDNGVIHPTIGAAWFNEITGKGGYLSLGESGIREWRKLHLTDEEKEKALASHKAIGNWIESVYFPTDGFTIDRTLTPGEIQETTELIQKGKPNDALTQTQRTWRIAAGELLDIVAAAAEK